ncbi:SpoIIE family protein phosphatase [Streptomyces sp. TP-A0874]|uniref:SpoIIE family protein phosphatase n=1 Tax=Streptomyces sp. TP-A0874 TaxID=549819 RepID=UPI0008538568|nr:SpoIIE family protein phosphatase [Streptomyces sp. TP-A0874]
MVGADEGDDLATAPASYAAATLLVDASGAVAAWSSNAERLLGYPAEEVIGQPVGALLAAEERQRFPAYARKSREEEAWVGLLSARHRDGHESRLRVRVCSLQKGGEDRTWLVIAKNLSRSPGWYMSRPVIERMISQSPIGTAVVDTDLRYVWSNAALERFGGGSLERRLGRRLGEVQPGIDVERLEDQMRQVLRTGQPIIDYEHTGHPRSDPRHEHAHSLSFVRLEDEDGRPLGVYYTVIDITDRYRALRRLTLLDKASKNIGRTMDILRTAQEAAEVAVPDFADAVNVDLLEAVTKGDEPAPGPIRGASTIRLRRSGRCSVTPPPGSDISVEVGELAVYHSWSPPIRCLATGESWIAEEMDPQEPVWSAGVQAGRTLRFGDFGFHTAMAVPIRARGVTLGVATFFRGRQTDAFDRGDLRLAEEFLGRAAVCIDNARRYTREREAALVLQRSLIPRGLRGQGAVEVASCYRPADDMAGVGGDWFDVIPLSGAQVALVVGEVAGQGIEAAAIMGRLRTAVQTLADLDLRPQDLLAHLDDLVVRVSREGSAGHQASGEKALGATCLYLIYDPVTRRCSMASAGHPGPVILKPDGTVDYPQLPGGPALGVSGLPFDSAELLLEEGSILALYTDGLLIAGEDDREAERTEGQGRLGQALTSFRGAELESLGQAVVDELVPGRPVDDVALLLARTRALGPDRVATWELLTDPAVVSRAREMATRQLSQWGLDELIFSTELIVSELVTNAIRHASGPLNLRLIRERSLICEVSDSSSTSPHLRHARTTDEGGRGLFLISQLTDRWGARYTPKGKVIWTEQPLTPEGVGR